MTFDNENGYVTICKDDDFYQVYKEFNEQWKLGYVAALEDVMEMCDDSKQDILDDEEHFKTTADESFFRGAYGELAKLKMKVFNRMKEVEGE